MWYGSEAWCLREKEMAILRRTERAMIRAMCGVKLLDQTNSEGASSMETIADRTCDDDDDLEKLFFMVNDVYIYFFDIIGHTSSLIITFAI